MEKVRKSGDLRQIPGMTITEKEYTISTDKDRLELAVIHRYLSIESYWCRNIPLETLRKALENSLNFGIYHRDGQVGFARLVTDQATFAYLADVFILPDHRGRGLSKWMMEQIVAHPDVQGLRRWLLATRDAHGLYAQFGWKPLANPDRFMERHDPHVYG
jgi:GNAT superfamily N-acetyltransferase